MVRTGVRSLVVAVVLGVSLSHAQGPVVLGTWGEHLGPQAPLSFTPALDWPEQAAIADASPRWLDWRAGHPGWVMLFDVRTRLAWRAYGPGIPVLPANPAKDGVLAAALALRNELMPVVGLDPADEALVTAVHAGHLWYVTFNQTVGGHRAWNCGLTLRLDDTGRLVMWGGRFVDPTNIPSKPTVSLDEARVKLLDFLQEQGYVRETTALRPAAEELIVSVTESRIELTPRLSWFFTVHSTAPAAVWQVFIDAVSGQVLTHWNDIREAAAGESGAPTGDPATPNEIPSPFAAALWFASISGVSTGFVHDGVLPSQAPVQRLLNDLRLVINGTNVNTDAVGAYTYNGGGTTVPVTSGLDGPWITTNNSAGAQATFSGNAASGTFDVPWTDTISDVAERDAFFFTNRARNNLMARNPSETLFNTAIATNVNLNQTCNAYYDPVAVNTNFFLAGGGCINSAYSGTVVEHEYGHHVTTRIYTAHSRSIPGQLGEGFSDCQAGACEDTNIIGAGFQGVSTVIRNMDNSCQYPSSCGTEVHAAGQLIGACYWHTRIQFANAFGAAGKVQMDQYLYRHFHGAPLTEVESCLDLLLQDDNDSNLTNGTPNLPKFYQGYTVQHAVPFPIQLVTFVHDPLNDTMDQLQPYQVHANVTSVLGGTFQSMQLYRSINGGAFTVSNMTAGSGTEWIGSIPVQPANATVSYYLRATASGGIVVTYPASAPLSTFTFHTYRQNVFYSDGFEVASGWTHAMVATQDDWQNQAPGNPNHAYDPPTAFEGTRCWGNDLSPASNWDGLYQNNVDNYLTSPTINCTGKTGITLSYRRWLTVEAGIYDHARILVSNNGVTYATIWENSTAADHLDTSWVLHAVPLGTVADNQPNVHVRFELISDPGLTYGGWNIDDLRLISASSTGPILSRLGGMTPGSVATIRTSGVTGDAVILAADITTGPHFYPSLGTISLNALSPSLVVIYPGNVTMPPAGLLDLTFGIPPGTSGAVVYLQAVLIPPATPLDPIISNVLTFNVQ